MSHPSKRPRLDCAPVPLVLPAVVIIARFLNPFELLQAVLVSRLWLSLFTCNSAWAHYNVYGIDKSIYKHYLATSTASPRDEFVCAPHKFSCHTNLYHVLARFRDPTPIARMPSILLGATALRPFLDLIACESIQFCMTFEHVPAEFHRDHELVYSLLRAGFGTKGLSWEYHHDRQAALSTIDREPFILNQDDREGEGLGSSDFVFSAGVLEHPDVALHAVSFCEYVYESLPRRLRADLDIFKAHASNPDSDPFYRAPSTIYENRELVLKVYQTVRTQWYDLCIPRMYHNDWEVVVAALSAVTPLDWQFARRQISPQILANRELLLNVLDLGWLVPLDWIPLALRIDSEILRYYMKTVEILAKMSFHELTDLCHSLQRLAALEPLCLTHDYDLIRHTLMLESAEVDAASSFDEMRALLVASHSEVKQRALLFASQPNTPSCTERHVLEKDLKSSPW